MPENKQSVDSGLSVVVPMYNEAENVATLVTEIQTALNHQVEFEIIVVDDGSQDGTLAQLQQLRSSVPQLVVLQHKHNAGQSAATVSGVRAARQPLIVTLDGDGQNNPQDILALYRTWQQQQAKYDILVVLGNRQQRHDTWVRRYCSRIANRVRRWMLQDDCPDTGCSLKLFPRDLFLQIPHFNHLHRYLPALFIRAGATTLNVPVDHRPRLRGTSKYGIGNRLWVGIVDLFGVRWLLKRPCRPEIVRDTQ